MAFDYCNGINDRVKAVVRQGHMPSLLEDIVGHGTHVAGVASARDDGARE